MPNKFTDEWFAEASDEDLRAERNKGVSKEHMQVYGPLGRTFFRDELHRRTIERSQAGVEAQTTTIRRLP